MSTTTLPVSVEAHQWFKNGDHPDDGVGQPRTDQLTGETYAAIEGAVVRFFRQPFTLGSAVDPACGSIWDDHGWIEDGDRGQAVCPGHFVLTVRTPGSVRYIRVVS